MNALVETLLAGALCWICSTAQAQDQTGSQNIPVFKMPGKSFSGPLPTLTKRQAALSQQLRRDAAFLTDKIGERNVYKYDKLVQAALFIEKSLEKAGYKNKVERQKYKVRGRECWNIIVELPGTTKAGEIVIIGAHYDSAPGAPGANDNGSGTVGALALARFYANRKPGRTMRFVFFVGGVLLFL